MLLMTSRAVLALLLLALPFAGTASAEEPLYREKLEDAPAEVVPRDDPAARSDGARLNHGSYVSVQVNVDDFGQNILGDAANEPSIAVNPTDPANIVIGWRQFDSVTSNFRQGGWSYTLDGGQTWTFPGVLTPGVFRSDPVLGFDSAGDAYYQSLQGNFTMDTFKSLTQGQTWMAPVPSFGGDKNWMVIDTSGGTGDGHIYGTWQQAFGCCGSNILTWSINGGASFESPVPVTFSPGIGTMAVGPDGELYSAGIREDAGQDPNTIVVARSTNAADPLQTPTFEGTIVDLGGSLGFFDGPNPGGLLGQINVVVDSSDGPSRGNVYLLASVNPFGPGDPIDVHFVRSVDGGATWSEPVRVNDDAPVGNWHWMGALGVAPNGRLDAIWNDTRNTGEVNLSRLFYSYSWDQGLTWSENVAASPTWDSFLGWPNQNKIGDYYDILSDETGADLAYAATFNGEQDVYYVRLFPDCDLNGVSDVQDIAEGIVDDCNGNHVPDNCEIVGACVSAGRVPDGSVLEGTPLTLDRDGSNVALAWGSSCILGDVDYAVYEGPLGGAFDLHTPKACTTNNQSSIVIDPIPGDAYYLIVPQNPANEGSYGANSDGDERAPGPVACQPQKLGPCLGI